MQVRKGSRGRHFSPSLSVLSELLAHSGWKRPRAKITECIVEVRRPCKASRSTLFLCFLPSVKDCVRGSQASLYESRRNTVMRCANAFYVKRATTSIWPVFQLFRIYTFRFFRANVHDVLVSVKNKLCILAFGRLEFAKGVNPQLT